ncbi:plexin-B-like isoform X2 [Mercenaria mercenaria]|uniref:plexin-B-like isoform X2 n=1 Tax=Mercenaria mercenaria TaxID=6596 RepID=UPI00234E52E5|nr:plexin-B-like isoform X2 [Mercenaria mercenaria]
MYVLLKGEYINLVAQESDVNITIGLEKCSVFELKENLITCLAPKEQPASRGSTLPEVNVTIGNYNKRVGFLKYEKTVEMILIIAGAVGGGLLAIIIIGVVFGIYKYKKVGKKAKEYERNLSDMEMEIKRVAREEFLDMHTTMSSVNKNLVEQGFPYHGYQQFACNVMFSVDYLWTEPVMTDDERLKANKGMESLELLISNKFFLVSVITTMENEKRFFIREKSNLAGNLCAVLMGRMDYLNEILKLLMTNLVQESSTKKHKTLFRRCESITEKLLSNWLSLCLYPHVKSHSGSPLYLLYMATQKTMESGPIDAVTGDAKYTLSEEKLLKKWSSSVEEDDNHDLKFEAKTLTLNVVVDNGEEIFKCKALDCDTVSQVKSKCLNQIYVNYPASQLPVGADDLALEWHEGFGGALRLRDEDNTSKREGHWVRLNTLAHYNVKDESNMALIDPHSAEINNQEDYVNLANINMEGVCDGSIDSSQPLTPHDEENPHEFEHWHLVKKEEESAKQGKSAIAELYLNRLFTTKQSLMEYMRPLFDLILDHDRCPPPTKFLYDFLDELGEKYKVETDTVHAWKSHSYAIRVWASLMKMPNTLFDVAIPSFMEENLNIISQVFIESFSLASQKFTKDSPSQKLIFHHEMNHYRDRVKEFYKNVKVDSQNSEEFRQYMAEVNRLQQQTNFNKVSALYRFYNQLKPYFEDILENLSKSKEASTLQLDRKLEQVIAIMEEED